MFRGVRMSNRRSGAQDNATSKWADFVTAKRHQFEAAGLPFMAGESIDHWDDLLRHGRFLYHHDATQFDVRGLAPEQYRAFATLVESYFHAGYEYFAPLALNVEDRNRLDSRFGPE
jgi:hypothetical protein